MNRTRAQRRYRRQGYTYETTYLKDPFHNVRRRPPKLILICKGASSSWRGYREYLLPGEVVRPIAKTYLHNGRKPR